MTATIDKVLLDKLAELDADQKESVLVFINKILDAPVQANEYTIYDYNRELDEADAEIDRGEFYTHEEATKIIKDLIGYGK